MLWPIFLFLLVAYGIFVRWKNRKLHHIHKQLPLPPKYKQVPILGYALYFLGDAQDHMKVIQEAGREIVDKYTGVCSVWLGHRFFVGIADAEAAEVVMKACLDKDDVLNVTRQLLGNGSLFAPAEIWRPRRRIMAPIFGQKTLNSFVTTFSNKSAILTDELKTVAGNRDIPIINTITKYAMDSVCANILGIQINSLSISIHPVIRAFRQYCMLTGSRLVKPWLYPDAIYKWTWAYPQYERSINILKEFVNEIIASKRHKMSLKKNDSVDHEDPKMKSLFELMIEAGGLTDLELQEEGLVMLLAGTDTTATTASFVTLMMAKYPEIQEKVYQEIIEVVGDSERHIEPDDLPKLKYLDLVVRETLRMYPVVPIIARKVNKNVTLPSGVTLVPGVGVVIHIWATQRNPKYWGPDANVFKPERFLEGPVKHPYAFLAFSNGPRVCVGAQYGMMSVKTLISHIIRRYRILPPSSGNLSSNEELPTIFEILLKHAHNFEVQLQLRKKENC